MPRVAILLDECLPVKLKYRFQKHDRDILISTVRNQGWTGIKNGRLLELAQDKFDVLVTVDKDMSFQQNISTYSIAIIAIKTHSNRYKDLITYVQDVAAICATVAPGEIRYVQANKEQG